MDRRLMLAALLVAALAIFGCLGVGESSAPLAYPGGSSSSESSGLSGAAGPGFVPPQYLDQSGRMVIKTGDANVEVPQGTLDAKYSELKTLVNANGGMLYGTQYGEGENSKYYFVTVRLPPAKFEQFSLQLASIGDVKSLNTATDDVTDQYVDLTVRIRNLEVEKVRLLEFYNRTSNVSELLEVEREVTRVQTEIEQLTAQKLNLERRAELGTMSVRLYEQAPMVDRTVVVPFNGLVSIFLQAISLSIAIVVAISGFLIPLFIGIGILVLLILGLKRLLARGRKKA